NHCRKRHRHRQAQNGRAPRQIFLLHRKFSLPATKGRRNRSPTRRSSTRQSLHRDGIASGRAPASVARGGAEPRRRKTEKRRKGASLLATADLEYLCAGARDILALRASRRLGTPCLRMWILVLPLLRLTDEEIAEGTDTFGLPERVAIDEMHVERRPFDVG